MAKEEKEKVKCPKCGAGQLRGAVFCMKCGTGLKGEQPPKEEPKSGKANEGQRSERKQFDDIL
jgi:uncharacterized Zn finger protein (UPF0148 family)